MFKIILTIGTIQILAVLIQFVKSKVVAIYLGPSGVGITGTIDQFVQFAAFLSVLGFPAASMKFLSKTYSESNESFKNSYAGFFNVLLLLSVTGAILIIGTILLYPGFLGEELRRYKLFLILGLTTLPTFTLLALFVNVFAASQRFRASSMLILFSNLVSMAAAVGGVLYAGLLGLYIGNLLAGLFICILVLVYFRTKLGLPLFEPQTNLKIYKNSSIFSTALLLYLSAVTASLSYSVARYSVLNNFGEYEAGLLHGVMVLAFAFGTALYPAINLYLNPLVNQIAETEVKLKQSIHFQRKLVLILCFASLPILFFPKTMLIIMFSEKFSEVSGIAYLFVISQLIVQLAGVYQALLVGLDDVKSYTFITSAGQIISAGLCMLLVPNLGIKGVAIAFLTGNSLNFAVSLFRLVIKYSFKIPVNVVVLVGYIFTVLFLTGLVSSKMPEWDTYIILGKIIFLLLFGGSLIVFLNKEEKFQINILRHKIIKILISTFL